MTHPASSVLNVAPEARAAQPSVYTDDAALTSILGPKCPGCGWRRTQHHSNCRSDPTRNPDPPAPRPAQDPRTPPGG